MLSMGILLALHAVISNLHGLPGRARLLAALDRAIDDYPRTEREDQS